MAFDSLSGRLQSALKNVTGKGKVSESDIDKMLREVRLSLLEADVNYKVVKQFLKGIKEQSLGEKVLKGLNPGEQVVKIVREELKNTLGSETSEIVLTKDGRTIIMAVGLQGAGKTTACGKMALYYRKKFKKKPMMIAADIYRPAAVDQLVTIGKQIGVPVFEMGTKVSAEKIVKEGLKKANELDSDFVIIDTAGRLSIDEVLMQELINIKEIANPQEVLLTIDSMTGQEAVTVAKQFNDKVGVTGVILTKMDSDTRGGAALSIKQVTNVPIKLMSTGEKLDTLEVFYPDRLADRILGMGDVLSLIDSVTENIDEDEVNDLGQKLLSNNFNYNDLKKQYKMIKKMGSMSKIMGMIPGISKMKKATENIDDKQLDYMEVMIDSMTEKERKNPSLVDSSAGRRKRIAAGSGKTVADVNKLRKSLEMQKQMAKKMSGMSEGDMESMTKQMQRGQMPSGMNMKSTGSKGRSKGKSRFRY